MHPVLLTLGPIKIYAYGTFLALAFIVATMVSSSIARKKGRDADLIVLAAVYIVLGAIVGSRLLYILLNPGPYLSEPLTIFQLTEGGLSLHGGVVGGVLAGLAVAVKHKAPFWPYADIVAPSIALGTGIARIGCFLNGCCYGTVTQVSWATLSRYALHTRHPSQLYEMLLSFALFGYLAYRLRKPAYHGQVFIHYAVGYSMVRFFVEFFRESGYILGPFSLAQVASVLLVLAFAGLGHYLKGRPAGEESAPEEPSSCPSRD